MIQPDATHFHHTGTQELAVALSKPVSFKLMYFPIHAAAATGREILAYGQAKWEDLKPVNWPEEKLYTPFHVLPVLYVKSQDGTEIGLSEVIIIEHYLGKQFSLLGDNEYEENVIKACHCSSVYIQNYFALVVTLSQPEVKDKMFEIFKTAVLPTWIQTHEKHLVGNGNNGHYVGNKLSLADLRTSNVIEHFALVPEAAELMEIINKSEALCKLRETVAKEPRIAEWRATEKYKKLNQSSSAFFANPAAFMPPK